MVPLRLDQYQQFSGSPNAFNRLATGLVWYAQKRGDHAFSHKT
jgi:hypothetical protein